MNSVVIPLGMPGHWEIIIIVLIVVIIFGGKRIPELFKGLGQGMREFKKATQEEENEKKESKKNK